MRIAFYDMMEDSGCYVTLNVKYNGIKIVLQAAWLFRHKLLKLPVQNMADVSTSPTRIM